MILAAMPLRHRNSETCRTVARNARYGRGARPQLAVLLAFFALLMPALLPFGVQPVAAVGSYVSPHAHSHAADATQPHDHGGGGEAVPDAAQLLSPAIFAFLLAVAMLATSFSASRHGLAPGATCLAPTRRFSRARPRAPPAQG